MQIRHAVAADSSALAHLMSELGYPTSIEEMATRLAVIQDRADYATFVAEVDGSVAGMVGVSVLPSLYKNDLDGAIVALVVSSRFRGQGIAGALVNSGETWILENGATYVSVKPSLHREDAHRLYSRLGYEHTGVRFTKSLSR